MANVSFKKGLSAALPWTGAAEGTFYLTSDTNRLYIGKADSTLAELNRYVAVVANTAALPASPAKDDFVYITDGNILAVCTNPNATNTADKWTQINPDTDTNIDTRFSSATATVTSTAADGIKVQLTFNNTQKDLIAGKDTNSSFSTNFVISANDLAVANKVDVDLGVDTATSGAKIILEGTGIGDNANTVTLLPGDNVTITPDATNDTITIAAQDTTYGISAVTGNKIRLTGGGKNDDVSFASANDAIELSTANDTITVKHKDYGTKAAVSTDATAAPSAGGTFTVVDSITTDKGHVTDYNVKTITLPEDQNYTYSAGSITADNTGKLTFGIDGGAGGSDSSKSSGQVLYYTVNGTKVYNQGSIDFYTKTEIDNKFNGVDAMTYKGTVSDTKALPTTAKVGDTYKVASEGFEFTDVDGNTITCEIGDLIIASGTETNGSLSGTALKWNYVPAGDDTDTQYDLSVANNVITLSNSTDSSVDTVTFTGDNNNIVVSTSGKTIKVAHETINATSKASTKGDGSPSNGGSFVVVDGFDFDNGHVTNYHTKTVTLPEIATSSTLEAVTAEGAGKIQVKDTGVGASGKTTSVTFNGDDAEITVATQTAGQSGALKVAHATHTANESTSAMGDTAPSHGGKFKVMDGITVNSYGHVTGYTTKEVTLPNDENYNYALSGAVAATTDATGVLVTDTLKGTNGGSTSYSKVAYTSSSLKIAAGTAASGENARVAIDIEWGSF